MFQSTHPHGVRLRLQGEPHHDLSFQSTHPHGVRPSYIEAQTVHSSVVSIHAPTRGATLCNPSYLAACCCFNPRTHTGCDDKNLPHVYRHQVVSIHAPTRGATAYIWRYCLRIPLFQSTHPHGVRHQNPYYSLCQKEFQSTHPHGVRPMDLPIRHKAICRFNPRTHTGCD